MFLLGLIVCPLRPTENTIGEHLLLNTAAYREDMKLYFQQDDIPTTVANCRYSKQGRNVKSGMICL
jgi:hypothetical protein